MSWSALHQQVETFLMGAQQDILASLSKQLPRPNYAPLTPLEIFSSKLERHNPSRACRQITFKDANFKEILFVSRPAPQSFRFFFIIP